MINRSGKSIFLLAILSLVLWSCSEEGDLGRIVLPESDFYTFGQDTIPIRLFTVDHQASISSYNSVNLLGSYTDPLFGTVTASFVTQFYPLEYLTNESITSVDSMILSLVYSADSLPAAIYGDYQSPQQVVVYEITESLENDSLYHSDFPIETYYQAANPIGTATISPDQAYKKLRIPLTGDILTKFATSDSATYSSDSLFWEFCKGLYLKTEGEGKAIYKFNLVSTSSRIMMYYQTARGKDSMEFQMGAAQKINLFEQDYTGTQVAVQLENPDTEYEQIYVQGLYGVKAKIVIDNNKLSQYSGKVIMKALLEIQGDSATLADSVHYFKGQMLLFQLNEAGTEVTLDEYEYNDTYLGVSENNDRFVFNITHHFQDLIDGRAANNGLVLFPANYKISPERVRLNGANHSKPSRLVITYAIIP